MATTKTTKTGKLTAKQIALLEQIADGSHVLQSIRSTSHIYLLPRDGDGYLDGNRVPATTFYALLALRPMVLREMHDRATWNSTYFEATDAAQMALDAQA